MSILKEGLIGNKGQGLVEILIAIAVFMLTVSATTMIFFGGESFAGKAIQSREAVQKAHDGFEALRFIRDNHWETLTDGVHGLSYLASGQWTLVDNPDTNNEFTRTVSISTDAYSVKHIDLTISWVHPSEGTKSIMLKQTLTAPGQGIIGNWSNPCVIGTANGSSGSKGTDIVYENGKAFVSSSASAAGKEDLFIFDVSNPVTPLPLGSLNVEEGWKSLAVSGNYVYGIEENSSDFFVVDVSNPLFPVKKTKLTLNGGLGRYVMVYGNYVFATTTVSLFIPLHSSTYEFFVVDISNPLAPVVVSQNKISADINEVSILQNKAYLATNDDNKELIVLDISDPINPVEVGSYNAPGTADGRSVYAKTATRVYLGRSGSFDDELLILNAIMPSSISLRGSANVSGSVYSIFTAGNITAMGTDDSSMEFQDYYTRDPGSIQPYGSINLQSIGTGADYFNNIIYMSVRNVDILQLISSC